MYKYILKIINHAVKLNLNWNTPN